jgi:hypothetical protein
MSDITVSKSAVWDSKLGGFVTTTTLENLIQFPSIPTGAVDATKSVENGTYRVTYKDLGDSTSGTTVAPTANYNYECHTSVSTEPLITFGSFQSGGTWALDDADKAKIKDAESDPTLWKTYATGTGGLAKYAEFILQGIESYYAPTVTLTITSDEANLPLLNNLGKIATITNTPTLPTGGNWLFSGCNFSALQNNKWRISREYRASGKNGWNDDLYGGT